MILIYKFNVKAIFFKAQIQEAAPGEEGKNLKRLISHIIITLFLYRCLVI